MVEHGQQILVWPCFNAIIEYCFTSNNWFLVGSPADRADLEVADEIIEVNGNSLENFSHAEIISHIHKVSTVSCLGEGVGVDQIRLLSNYKGSKLSLIPVFLFSWYTCIGFIDIKNICYSLVQFTKSPGFWYWLLS